MRMIFRLSIVVLFSSGAFAQEKRALIFGITGQDGTYLAEFLLESGYEVHGVIRNTSLSNTSRIDYLLTNVHYHDKFFLHYGDLTDQSSIIMTIQKVDPHEVYNLAAQSHVRISFDVPQQTADVDAMGVLRILEAIRKTGKITQIKYYQASTSEMFGKVASSSQNETTKFHPRSPYAVSKLFAYWMTINYREAYGLFACNGILFNHESPIRGEVFVTRKISRAVAQWSLGNKKPVKLGNLDAYRDWGYAGDYVKAMWLMLQQEKPDDYVIATGQTHSVREFVEIAFRKIGIEIEWRGEAVDEVGFDKLTGEIVVTIDPRYFRPTEVDVLCGDAHKAHKMFQWKPEKSFEALVELMVQEDIRLITG
jgi:GDPmannose 4,6-dehydratase